ncbi:hypothetical protein WMY93_012666 [Mugilogobius chulae]|uniref:Uncharacterized protein n=1 Tax=Mugilogobius chulae TaxID=88201 RepID=A0AAW0NX89_9GOBI
MVFSSKLSTGAGPFLPGLESWEIVTNEMGPELVSQNLTLPPSSRPMVSGIRAPWPESFLELLSAPRKLVPLSENSSIGLPRREINLRSARRKASESREVLHGLEADGAKNVWDPGRKIGPRCMLTAPARRLRRVLREGVARFGQSRPTPPMSTCYVLTLMLPSIGVKLSARLDWPVLNRPTLKTRRIIACGGLPSPVIMEGVRGSLGDRPGGTVQDSSSGKVSSSGEEVDELLHGAGPRGSVGNGTCVSWRHSQILHLQSCWWTGLFPQTGWY